MTSLLAAYGTTAFLLGEYTEEDILRYPEFALADGIVELSRRRLGNRDERFFRVYKLRGSPYLEARARSGSPARGSTSILGSSVRRFPRDMTRPALCTWTACW